MRALRGKIRLLASTLGVIGLSATASASAQVNYTYDPVGRLTTARYDNGLCIAYAYDQNGNRTSQINSTGSTSPTWAGGAWGCFMWTPQ